MKKMVCEICESQSIKKENDVFVCQECGTEYSLGDARNLLKEVGENTITNSVDPKELNMTNSQENKYELVKKLSLWLNVIMSLEDTDYWFGFKYEPTSAMFWDNVHNIKSIEAPITSQSVLSLDIINGERACYHFHKLYIGKLADNKPTDIFAKSKLKLLCDVIYSCKDSMWKHLGLFGKIIECDYNISIRSEDGTFNKKIHDMCIEGSILEQIIELSKTKKKYYLNRIVVETKGFSFVNKDTRWTFSDLDVTKTIENAEKFVEALKEYDKLVIDNFTNEYPQAKEEYIKLSETIRHLESEFMLPLKYRMPEVLYKILEIIAFGRADNWKEAINLYETEVFRDQLNTEIHNGLLQINKTLENHLANISLQLKQLNNSIDNVSTNLQVLNARVKKISGAVNFLATDRFING